jgi:glycine/D-amino acid oxidase-like deaminating enzyme
LERKPKTDAMLTPDFTTDPYWWLDAPLRDVREEPLPADADVAIIGAGYTGLSAALTLARGGRAPLILEADLPGAAASTRNAGNLNPVLKTGFAEFREKYGLETAAAFYREARTAMAYLGQLIEDEGIACGFARSGRFYAAHSARAYESLARELGVLRDAVGFQGEMVPRAEQGREIGGDSYFGGQVVHDAGFVHGALYHQGLMARACAAGADIHAHTRVTGIARDSAGFSLETNRGRVTAREVILATNAETGGEDRLFRHFRRRLVPIRTFAAATEPVPADLIKRILPSGRPVIDTHKILNHIQPSPDGSRLILGGRACRNDHGALRGTAERLHRHFSRRFPDLADVRISHCWDGLFAFTFDHLPHVGMHEGVHYALGFCGTGIPMGTWLGH